MAGTKQGGPSKVGAPSKAPPKAREYWLRRMSRKISCHKRAELRWIGTSLPASIPCKTRPLHPAARGRSPVMAPARLCIPGLSAPRICSNLLRSQKMQKYICRYINDLHDTQGETLPAPMLDLSCQKERRFAAPRSGVFPCLRTAAFGLETDRRRADVAPSR